jgi:hypothetical protein
MHQSEAWTLCTESSRPWLSGSAEGLRVNLLLGACYTLEITRRGPVWIPQEKRNSGERMLWEKAEATVTRAGANGLALPHVRG